jgi:uncharacterized protein (TIGR02449 family)
MEEILQRLEKRIKKLIDQHDQLKQANYELHKGKYMLAREKESLLAKQLKAISQIEILVSKLRAIDKL